ncbi:MAG: adenylate/guanylate cyclase domain-containing protein [Alphaproteobacteria bacterium]|nr:adenylate/guanylate cyclase domain-containing protein [Alphaproteobacteria bacterium]
MHIAHGTLWKLQSSIIALTMAVIMGAAYATAIGGRAWVGAVVGLTIGSLIAALEVVRLGKVGANILRRQGLLPLIGVTTFLWAVIIIGTLHAARYVFGHSWGATPADHPHSTFIQDIAFAFAVGFLVSFVSRLQGLIGTRTLLYYLAGRYARPVQEDRTILILDLADSTALAERLGALKVQELICQLFFDISEPITEHGGEIHNYIGDAVVVTWPTDEALLNAQCIRCVFAIQELIRRNAERYAQTYGVIPEFRGGLHCGTVVVSEVGDTHRAIDYFGDTMNTTARLQQSCKEFGENLMVSKALISTLELPQSVEVEAIGEIALEGKTQTVEAFGLHYPQDKPLWSKR